MMAKNNCLGFTVEGSLIYNGATVIPSAVTAIIRHS